jgi:ketosteroid isomerase-like protein
MQATKRSVLVAAGIAGLGMPAPSSVAAATQDSLAIDQDVADLARRSEASNAALMRGDLDTYRALITLSDDFTLMTPFGGMPTRGSNMTTETWVAIAQFFRNGTLKQDLIQAYRSSDLVVLVVIEHNHVEVGGLPAQDWPLRVTLVYRQAGAEWRLAHRHADPLLHRISLEQAAALASG